MNIAELRVMMDSMRKEGEWVIAVMPLGRQPALRLADGSLVTFLDGFPMAEVLRVLVDTGADVVAPDGSPFISSSAKSR